MQVEGDAGCRDDQAVHRRHLLRQAADPGGTLDRLLPGHHAVDGALGPQRCGHFRRQRPGASKPMPAASRIPAFSECASGTTHLTVMPASTTACPTGC
jgi:hypothetical protein